MRNDIYLTEKTHMPLKQQISSIESPCTKVCTLDFDTGFCYGCGRNSCEISQWGNFSDAEKQQIIDGLPNRLKAIDESV